MGKYEYTKDMGEISGFGGGYEDMRRAMVVAGLEFWDEQGDEFDPQFKGFKGVYGLIEDTNDDAVALTNAVLEPSDGGATGAMHQAAISHIFAVRRLGWEGYVEEMSKEEEDAV